MPLTAMISPQAAVESLLQAPDHPLSPLVRLRSLSRLNPPTKGEARRLGMRSAARETVDRMGRRIPQRNSDKGEKSASSYSDDRMESP